MAEFGLNDCGFGYMGKITNSYIDILSTNVASQPPTSSFRSYLGHISVNGSSVGNTQFETYAITMAFNFATRNNNAQFDLYCSGVKSTLTSASVSKSTSTFKYGDLLVIQNQDGDNVAALSKDGDLKTVKGVFTADTDSIGQDRKSTRLNSSHSAKSRMPSSA